MPCAAIDLFCGVGGLTKGLEQAGINVVAGIDFEASCQYAYEENNNAKFIQRDITTVLPEELAALYPDDLNIHILAGCAPCQPFSKYTQRYRKDGYKDEKWRLLYSFGTLAKGIKPEIIAMENVPELEKTPVFADFVKELEECGYHIFHKIVYCPDYGVPQSRKRLVLLASLFGKISLLPATHTPDKSDSEVRRGSYPGKLTSYIEKCCKNELFVALCPISKNKAVRQERFELVLRFFAYLNDYKHFEHEVNPFLNDFLAKNLDSFDEQQYETDFIGMLNFVQKHFQFGFAKSQNATTTPRVRFEAISVGVALALRAYPNLEVKNVDWLNSEEFKVLTTSDASNNEGKLVARVEYVRDRLIEAKVNDCNI